jgi:predicted GH43/DUF377 family glycosyl hydrolase
MKLQGSPFDPYPIFLGYAVSHDNGDTWDADFSRPALSPKLSYDIDGMYITDDEGNKVVNYANGCIEDPRIFQVEGKLYISAACRMFPPGPYWIDDPAIGTTHTNIPAWAKEKDNPFGSVALYNETVTVLYALDLDRLIERDYDNAFTYICPLTDGNVDDNRDVFPFPEKMTINGTEQYVLIHRPHNPSRFAAGKGYTTPSVMMAAAANIKDFATEKATHQFTATSIFDWEEERIGGSWPPIKLNENEWLFAYHGKQYPGYGYSQSFMILTRAENEFPTVKHRCSERLMYAKQPWEMPDKFACPCIFTTAGIVVDGTLIMSYGAADQKVGICKVNFEELVRYIRLFDEKGASRG